MPFPAVSYCKVHCTQTAFPYQFAHRGEVFKDKGSFKNKCQRSFPSALCSVAVLYQKAKWPHARPTLESVDISFLEQLQEAWQAAWCLFPSSAISKASPLPPLPLPAAELPPKGFLPCGLLKLWVIKHISYSSLPLTSIQYTPLAFIHFCFKRHLIQCQIKHGILGKSRVPEDTAQGSKSTKAFLDIENCTSLKIF